MLARQLEEKPVQYITGADRVAHQSHVVSAIMQACASLEAEIWEVLAHGPGHHLGSNGIDRAARDLLGPVAELVDRHRDTLARYEIVLHLLHRAAFVGPSAVRNRGSTRHWLSDCGTKSCTISQNCAANSIAPIYFLQSVNSNISQHHFRPACHSFLTNAVALPAETGRCWHA
jgi:hypothetical protein